MNHMKYVQKTILLTGGTKSQYGITTDKTSTPHFGPEGG